ncbi:protein turtle homolog A [Terrapene carolina triunguis]|uniref:protein turtle homolog A n=1 Tax=Terrapene triunguis TaxID=2587831 RepID=UPI000E77B2CA|nr:protein turtle homolog A [Terrapene carolina triunguis]
MNWCLWIAYFSLFTNNFAEGNGQVESQAVVGRVGESVILGCDLLNAEEARPHLYVIEWVRFGFLLPIFIKFGLYSPRVDPDHLQSRVRVLVDGSLLLQKTTPDDAGKYTCVPSNGLRKPPSASAFLTVLYPAQVTTMPPETLLPMGMQGMIQCPTKANPPLLSISWTKDGHPLELDKFPGWSMAPDGSIVITTGNDDALGLYTCTPYNSYGTAGASAPTRVLLKDPPVFTLRPKEEYFQEVGRELVIPCAAQGDPPPTVTWAKLGSTGRNDAQVDGNSSLVFRPLVKEQHGAWECTVSNQVARISTTTSVYVLGTSPHAVTNVSVLPLLLAANVSWQPGFDGGYFQRFSVWYTPLVKHLNRPHHDWVSLTVPVGAGYLLVENLQPATGYQFSVLSQNKLGSGPFSEIVTSFPLGFPTTEVPPELPTTATHVFLSPPQSLTANETSRGVLLQWEPPLQFSVALTGYALELRQDQGGWEGLDGSIPSTKTQVLVPGLIKDACYEFRLVAFAGIYMSDPSNTVNVSTAGMEVYPSRTQLPELLPQPVLAGVIGGICFLSVAVIFSTMVACIMNRRRAARLQKRRQDPPIVFSPNKKLPPPQNSRSSGSPDSAMKLKRQASPYQSLRRTLLWGERAGTSLGLTIAGGPRTSSKYTVYESHIGDTMPLERICRGPDGRFVVETDRLPREASPCALETELFPELLQQDPSPTPPEPSPPAPYLQVYAPPEAEEPVWKRGVPLRPKATGQARREARSSGYRQGRYFSYCSSPMDEAKPLCSINLSPVASPMPLPLSTVEEPRDGMCCEGHCQSTVSTLLNSPGPGGSPVLSRLLSAPALASPKPLGSGSPSSQQRASSSAQSGILQYLSLPFFKEMSVDGDWPPQEEPRELQALGSTEPTLLGEEGPMQSTEGAACLDYMDTRGTAESPLEQAPSKALLKPPEPQMGPAKAALPGSTVWPGYLGPSSDPLLAKEQAPWGRGPSPTDSSRTELMYTAVSSDSNWALSLPGQPLPAELLEAQVPEKHQAPGTLCLQGPPAEKLLRGSLTSQSSGRGSVSFLRPPSLALSLGGTYLSSPLGETAGWQSESESRGSMAEEGRPRKELVVATVSKRRNTSVDENYEWDSEFALESDILDALQLYRSGDPKRPVSTIAVQELERQSAKAPGDGSGSPGNSKSVDALEASGSLQPLASPEARCVALREEFLAYRRRREVAQRRRQRMSSHGYDERFEQATLL